MKLTKDGLRAYYVQSDLGCGIRWYRSKRSAIKQFTAEVGTANDPLVRRATEEDIAWVQAMGGATA